MSQNPYPELPRMAEPIEYVTPSDVRGRPGILTAVGIVSIIMAILGFGAAGMSGMMGLGMYMMSVTTRGMGATAAPTITPALQANVFTDSLALNEPQLKQLGQLLKDHGEEVAGTDLSPGFITDSASRTGADGRPYAYYSTRTGKLEVYDDRVMFVPTSGYPIRNVTADPDAGPESMVLTELEVQKILARVQTLTSRPLTDAQTKTLKAKLQAADQGLIRMPNKMPETAITHAIRQNDGSVMVLTANGNITIAKDGSVTMFTTYTTNTVVAGGVGGPPKVDESAALLTIISSGLNVLLSIYLLVIGILVLNDFRNGRFLHRLYAYVKLAVVVGAGLAQYWLMMSLMQNSPTGAVPTWFGMASVIGIGMGCIYPIALLIVFGTQRVKEYYSASWIGTAR